MNFLTVLLLQILIIFSAVTGFLFVYHFLKKKASEKMVDRTSGIIKNVLIKETPIEITMEEKKKYYKKNGLYVLIIFFIFFMMYLCTPLLKEGLFKPLEALLFSIPIAIAAIIILLKDYLFLKKRKIYRMKAYVTQITYGRGRTYHLVYYDFVKYSFEGTTLNGSMNSYTQTLEAGSYVEILASAGRKHVRPFDYAK